MDLHIYCRKNNLVRFDEFIADLWSKEIIFLGEGDHFSPRQERNEEIILTELVKRSNPCIVAENISNQAYHSKRKMLSEFSLSGLGYLASENPRMAEELSSMINAEQQLVVVVGSLHLVGPSSVDALVKRKHPQRKSVTVFLDDQIRPQGIYRKQTPAAKDYIVAGNL